MDINECYYLGRITKPWGVKGQMVLFLDVDNPADYQSLDSAFVEIKGTLVPHFFTVDQLNANKAIVTFEDMTPEQTSSLAGHDLYLPLSLLPPLDGNRFYYHEVVGFQVIDAEHGNIGILQEVIDYPAQALFRIDCVGKEILIPVIDPVIDRLDRTAKILYIKAPAGLIDLYLDA